MQTETIDRLFLELAQVTTAQTPHEIELREANRELRAEVAKRDTMIVQRDAIIAEMRAVLSEVEWGAWDGDDDDPGSACPMCLAARGESSNPKHEPDCRLAAAIGRKEPT